MNRNECQIWVGDNSTALFLGSGPHSPARLLARPDCSKLENSLAVPGSLWNPLVHLGDPSG